jgi:hypothetical protein
MRRRAGGSNRTRSKTGDADRYHPRGWGTRQAAEFLSKKDYTDNWKSEMSEEFCFWKFSQWKQALTEIDFQICENPINPTEGSDVYTNPWIVEHRHVGHTEITDLHGRTLPWPSANMVLVAEKPVHLSYRLLSIFWR